MMNISIANPDLPDFNFVKASLCEVWDTGIVSNFGKYCKKFENAIKDYVGCDYVLAVSNCTLALKVVCAAYKFTDDVVIPSFTFNATYMAPAWNGAKIKLVDVDGNSLLADLNQVEDLCKKGFKKFILVNVFGNLYNINEINSLEDKWGAVFVFDSAHSFGSTRNDKKSGNLEHTECFSFSPTKLITSGEGGVICTNNKLIYEDLLCRRNYGIQKNYDSIFVGCNGKISEFNAIVGYHSICMIDALLAKKRKIFNRFKKNLPNFYFQSVSNEVKSTYKDLILLNLEDSWGLQAWLEKNGIETKKYFLPLHKQIINKEGENNFPVSDNIYHTSLCVPSHTKLNNEEIDYICDLIKEFHR